MDNVPTTQTGIINGSVSGVTVSQVGISSITPNNQSVSGLSINQDDLDTARIEGLWVERVSPWQLEDIWNFVSLARSNTTITNL